MTALQVFARIQECFGNNTPGAIADLLTEDSVVEWPFTVPGAPTRLVGAVAFREYQQHSPVASLLRFDGLIARSIHETKDPDVIVVETTTCGTVLTTGKRFELLAIGVIKVRDGGLLEWRDYVNPIAGSEATGTLNRLIELLQRDR